MKFLATEFRLDGEYGVVFEANNLADAQAYCDEHEYRLDGSDVLTIPVTSHFGESDANEMITQLNASVDAIKH